jgi:CBS domain containing-hemolysin-like protein
MGLLVIILTATLAASFICSLMESVILSVTSSYIALLIKNSARSGRLLKKMKKDINHSLSAVLTLNTVANVLGASGVGAQSYSLFGDEWVALISGIMTILVLIIAEIIPKTIGAVYWKKLAPVLAYIIPVMIFVMYPAVFLLEKISRSITKKGHHNRITRDELIVLAEIGHSEGIINDKEARIIKNLLALNEIRTDEILTPRAVVFALQKDETVKESVERIINIPFSRIPVYDLNLDSITGIVLRKELLKIFYTGDSSKKLNEIMLPVYAVPESKTIAELMNEFIERREHMFVVIDEYGGTAGIVTLEDAIETLLGEEIVDEFESIDDLRVFAVERWKQRRKKLRGSIPQEK